MGANSSKPTMDRCNVGILIAVILLFVMIIILIVYCNKETFTNAYEHFNEHFSEHFRAMVGGNHTNPYYNLQKPKSLGNMVVPILPRVKPEPESSKEGSRLEKLKLGG